MGHPTTEYRRTHRSATGDAPRDARTTRRQLDEHAWSLLSREQTLAIDLARALFLTGQHPHEAAARNLDVRPGWCGPGGVIVRTSWRRGDRIEVVAGAGWVAVVTYDVGLGTAIAYVNAVSQDQLHRVTATLPQHPPVEPDPRSVQIELWSCSPSGDATAELRTVDCEPWAEIRRNYPPAVAAAFDRVVALDAAPARTRLLLLHGEPGTGKTSALRSLSQAWKGWARPRVVSDPEQLFGRASYLREVVLDDAGARRAPFVIIEDVDELIRADAKQRTGPALSRLLNVTDGFLGQGLPYVLALTTNEPIHALHPALTRPGRCLAGIEFTRFSASEAAAWLGDGRPPPERGATLAELYALAAGADDPVTSATDDEDAAPTGLYL